MRGFSLIEALVAIFILSFGLLALAGSQITALRNTQQAYWISLANSRASSLFKRLSVNHSTSARQGELLLWNKFNQQELPDGTGNYYCQSNNKCTVTVTWLFDGKQSISMSST